ncbi:hypothetical protein Mgra_00006754 [Meloidogyne graminicola]|uniref:Uncharacterized protein n=1 Tax=Meloidogyne graminicola TaxID=189291 RepID=A0A8S9ZKI6_9BILA|nr:hypothetical protein Mgra_00006754 [Meloidogyne graminicola]
MPQNNKLNSNLINKTEYLYKGSAYRSVAFGTWSVGDASQHFKETKKNNNSIENERKKEKNLLNSLQQNLKIEENKNELIEQINKKRKIINKDLQNNQINFIKNIFGIMNNNLIKNSDFYSSTEYEIQYLKLKILILQQ